MLVFKHTSDYMEIKDQYLKKGINIGQSVESLKA